jgi:hypothetical protein
MTSIAISTPWILLLKRYVPSEKNESKMRIKKRGNIGIVRVEKENDCSGGMK